jgi:hypothetical protein
VVDQVVWNAACPVVVVRPPGIAGGAKGGSVVQTPPAASG